MLLTFRRRITTDQLAFTDADSISSSSSSSSCSSAVEGGRAVAPEGEESASVAGGRDGRGRGRGPKDLYSVLLQPNSLLVFRETLYSDFLHGIADGNYFETIDATSQSEREGGGGVTATATATDADTDAGNACVGQEREKELQRHDMTCICLNKAAAGLVAGQRVERLNRTSLTFRRVRTH